MILMMIKKSKINDIRIIISRLGNIVTENVRKKIKKRVFRNIKKAKPSENEKEKIYIHLVKLGNTFDKKKKINIGTGII